MKKMFSLFLITLILVSCVTKFSNGLKQLDYNHTLNSHFRKKTSETLSKDVAVIGADSITKKGEEAPRSNKIDSHVVGTQFSLQIETNRTVSSSGSKSSHINEQPIAPPNSQNVLIEKPIEDVSPPVESAPPPVEIPIPSLEEPKELVPKPLCPNAWYDENKACDWIHPNLKPTDEVGRTVPTFTKPEDAWNWAEKQLFDETSTWYMCGFNLMDGHTNDGTTFFYGYMKACP